MDKRSIIIFWKWENKKYNSEISVHGLDDCKIYSLSYSADNLINCIEFINAIPSEKISVLLHTNDPNNFTNEDMVTIKKQTGNSTPQKKIYLFGGGADNDQPIYYHPGKYPKGILGNIDFADDALVDKKDKLKAAHFEFVWDWYWNKLDLENQKKNLINLWLPLAIDIQGLSEVKDEKKKEEYFEEIKGSIKSYKDSVEKDWEKIKNSFSDFDIPSSILNKITSEFTVEEFYKEFANNNNDNFLPNWLQKNVTQLDNEIAGTKSEK